MERRAKILVTLGPACSSKAAIQKLVAAGADGVRLNFSHGDRAEHAAMIQRVRDLAGQLDQPITILQDLQGPKLRTSNNAGGDPIHLEQGKRVTITTAPGESEPGRIHVDYEPLPRDVHPGDRILIDDGRIELTTRSTSETEVEAEVVVGGELKSHKGINLPGVKLSAESMTDKDRQDLKFGLEQGVDMIAMSFVRRGEDIAQVDRLIEEHTGDGLLIPVIGKLERQEALDNLEDILEESDGVMVARGDLGVEVAAERVPSLQKRIISAANAHNRLVITATQMLESMVRNPRPTRAEASDVANAIFDGSDVLMLSGETAVGSYPVRSVETMRRIIMDAEAHTLEWGFKPLQEERATADDATATTQAASDLAEDRGAGAIGVFTRSGRTALLMSKARPSVPILAFTPERQTYNRMALFWGVEPHLIPMADSVEEMIGHVERALLDAGAAQDGDRVVIVASLPVGALGPANMTYLHTIGGSFKS